MLGLRYFTVRNQFYLLVVVLPLIFMVTLYLPSRFQSTCQMVLTADRWSQVRAVCHEISRIHSSSLDQVLLLTPLQRWTWLRTQAAAASIGCQSSTFPLREGIRLYQASEILSSQAQQQSHGYLVSSLPLEYSELTAVLNAARVCEIAEDMEWRYRARSTNETVGLNARSVREALCGVGGGVLDTTTGLSSSITSNEALVSIVRPCGVESGSAVWSALLDGRLPSNNNNKDSTTPPSSTSVATIECGVHMPPAKFLALLTQNYRTLHDAPEMATFHHPAELSSSFLNQVPPIGWNPNLPLLHPNTAELAAATNDTPKLLRLLLPGTTGHHLLGDLMAFNVMVSPFGVLQSLNSVLKEASPIPTQQPGECPQLLQTIFEEEPTEFTMLKERSRQKHIEAVIGGKDALRALQMRSPTIWFTRYWPSYAGTDLNEWIPRNGPSNTFMFDNTPLPNNDEVEAPHAACVDWDLKGEGRDRESVKLVDEVVILAPAANSYYWITVDLIGRLILMLPYLRDHPEIKIHVPYYYSNTWKPGHHAYEWFHRLGLMSRVVSGRIIARVAHQLDRMPCGPRQHPLQLLAVRDAGRMIIAQQPQQSPHPQPQPPTQEDRDRTVLVVRRNTTRRISNHQQLVDKLALAGLQVLVHDVEDTTTPWEDLLRLWPRAGAVVAPHGAGLTNAAFLEPGSALIEAVPKGHAGLGLYYFQLAHYMRLRYHNVIVPGSLMYDVSVDPDGMLWLVCGVLNCNFSAPLQPPWPAVKPRAEPFEECLPTSKGVERQPLTAYEPVLAQRPFLEFNFANSDAPDKPYFAWISTEQRLRLSQVEGIALLLGASVHLIKFFAFEPSQRRFLMALERNHILPVHVPNSVTGGPYQNYVDNCTSNIELQAVVQFTIAIMNAVLKARGLSEDTRLPIFTFGLSSGAVFTGILASHMRVDAAIVQLEPPIALADHLVEGALLDGGMEGPGECQRVLAELPPSLRPREFPYLWMTAAPLNAPEAMTMQKFRNKMIERGVPPSRLVLNHWIPKPASYSRAHEAAPWLISPAAGRVVMDILYAFGVIGDFPDVVASLESFGPVCKHPPQHPQQPQQPQQPLASKTTRSASGPLFHSIFHRQRIDLIPIWNAIDAALRSALISVDPVNRKAGTPMLFAAFHDPDFPPGAQPFHLLTPPPAECLKPYTGMPVSDECEVLNYFLSWVWRFMVGLKGEHEFHESHWEEMVEWLLTAVRND